MRRLDVRMWVWVWMRVWVWGHRRGLAGFWGLRSRWNNRVTIVSHHGSSKSHSPSPDSASLNSSRFRFFFLFFFASSTALTKSEPLE